MKWIRTGSLTIGLLLTAGCSTLQPVKKEVISTYALQAQFQNVPAAAVGAPVLLVTRPRAHPGFETSRMAYVRKAHELEYFSLNQWVDTPEKMLAPLLVQAFEASGAFSAVSQATGAVTAQLRLDSEIVRLQQEFTAAPSRIHFTMRAQLIDVAGRRIIATREFDVTENANSDDPYGGVVAASHAVHRTLSEVAAFFAAQARGFKP
ncbi:MAG: ABC-type transport auxiliary lipoprotein family protein [Sulfuricella denitrificans]|nr:ABC-type transport auxiliary lipoprotein family protein [Sulfuricella denitrificans]